MTIVEGQIETLRKLRESLTASGLTRFGSIGEIRRFLKNFETERAQLPNRARAAIEKEIQSTKADLDEHQQSHYRLEADIRSELKQEISDLEAEQSRIKAKCANSKLLKAIYFLKAKSLSHRIAKQRNNLGKTISKRVRDSEEWVATLESRVKHLLSNKEPLVDKRIEESLADLTKTKTILDDHYSLIAGAIGENAVVNTLKELSDDCYLINDFSLKFDRPIYNRKENDRIYSIQVDHLLISRAGVFLLETKNWSKASIESLDLRSPVAQIRRTGFALFVLLNGKSGRNKFKLKQHHWGDRKIPIKNLIVMTNEKPKADFKHVKVLSLKELNDYIQYFDQTLDHEEVKNIFENLRGMM